MEVRANDNLRSAVGCVEPPVGHNPKARSSSVASVR